MIFSPIGEHSVLPLRSGEMQMLTYRPNYSRMGVVGKSGTNFNSGGGKQCPVEVVGAGAAQPVP